MTPWDENPLRYEYDFNPIKPINFNAISKFKTLLKNLLPYCMLSIV